MAHYNIEIDPHAGFCFGVVKAIGAAEQELAQTGSLYCLGDIVHNSAEVERLQSKGLRVIDHTHLMQMGGGRVLIRAHGEPPSTYTTAAKAGITLIDATCPIVLALQQKVRAGYEQMQQVGGQVLIFGKPGHAEVIGLNGQAGGTAIIISSPEGITGIDFKRPIRLYSQTTKSREDYRQLIANIKQHLDAKGDFVAYDTICNRVANRAAELKEFASRVDVLLFVAGADSSNGHYLYEYCRAVQPRTYLLQSAADLAPHMLQQATTIGISGATSTPRWLMEQVKTTIEN